MSRPAVSVVVPFRGDATEAARVLDFMGRLRLGDADELIVVDNNQRRTVPASSAAEVILAPAMASSYHARNCGAERAANEWILFLDADTRPPPSLLDDYFVEAAADDEGILAGETLGAPEQRALTARHARARGHLHVGQNALGRGPSPAGSTANMVVRRAAWAELGGFREVRSGADFEFCWRAYEHGWRLAYRPSAVVEHLHAETLRRAMAKMRRYGYGQAWLDRCYPGSAPSPPLARQIARAVAGGVVWSLTLRFERAAFKLLDGAFMGAYSWGYYRGDNRATPLAAAAIGAGGSVNRQATEK